MKKVIFMIFVFISIIAIYGCTKNNTNKDALKFKEEYETLNNKKIGSTKNTYPKLEINKNNPIKYADVDSILDLLNSGSGIIYLGYPECPWCRNAVPVLLEAAEELEIDTIYYLNMKDERDEAKVKEDGTIEFVKKGTTGYKKLLTRLDSILEDYTLKDMHGNTVNVYEKRIYVPIVIFVREGDIVGYHTDTVTSQQNPLEPLNKEQKNELMNIYTSLIHKVLNDVCDSNC